MGLPRSPSAVVCVLSAGPGGGHIAQQPPNQEPCRQTDEHGGEQRTRCGFLLLRCLRRGRSSALSFHIVLVWFHTIDESDDKSVGGGVGRTRECELLSHHEGEPHPVPVGKRSDDRADGQRAGVGPEQAIGGELGGCALCRPTSGLLAIFDLDLPNGGAGGLCQ